MLENPYPQAFLEQIETIIRGTESGKFSLLKKLDKEPNDDLLEVLTNVNPSKLRAALLTNDDLISVKDKLKKLFANYERAKAKPKKEIELKDFFRARSPARGKLMGALFATDGQFSEPYWAKIFSDDIPLYGVINKAKHPIKFKELLDEGSAIIFGVSSGIGKSALRQAIAHKVTKKQHLAIVVKDWAPNEPDFAHVVFRQIVVSILDRFKKETKYHTSLRDRLDLCAMLRASCAVAEIPRSRFLSLLPLLEDHQWKDYEAEIRWEFEASIGKAIAYLWELVTICDFKGLALLIDLNLTSGATLDEKLKTLVDLVKKTIEKEDNSLSGYPIYYKLFLNDEIRGNADISSLQESCKWYVLDKWNVEHLHAMFVVRLKNFAPGISQENDPVNYLLQVYCNEPEVDAELLDDFASLADGSPCKYIKFWELVFSVHCRIAKSPQEPIQAATFRYIIDNETPPPTPPMPTPVTLLSEEQRQRILTNLLANLKEGLIISDINILCFLLWRSNSHEEIAGSNPTKPALLLAFIEKLDRQPDDLRRLLTDIGPKWFSKVSWPPWPEELG